MTMTRQEAEDRLRSMTSASVAPVLTSEEIVTLLDDAQRADLYLLAPTDTGWTPTYDLNAAACAGWRLKAGKVATEFSFSTDGQSFNRGEQRAACLEMAEQYRRKTGGTISLVTCAGTSDLIVNLNDG